MATFHLQIVAPDRVAYDGQAESILVRTVTGDVEILARHIDYTAPLGIGQAIVKTEDGTERYAACNSGLISVSGNEVRVITCTFEWQEEIDLARAEAAKAKAEEELKKLPKTDENYALMDAKMKRAIARMRAGRY